jgi:hypothetical protein
MRDYTFLLIVSAATAYFGSVNTGDITEILADCGDLQQQPIGTNNLHGPGVDVMITIFCDF